MGVGPVGEAACRAAGNLAWRSVWSCRSGPTSAGSDCPLWRGNLNRALPSWSRGDARRQGAGHLTQVADVDAYHAELKARGVDIDEEVGRFGDAVPPTFWLRDNERNILQVTGAN